MYEDLIKKAVDYHDDLVRNIKGIRTTQALFDDISDDARDNDVAVEAEASGRIPSSAPLITRPFDYGAVISYPFVPYNWHETRFADGLDYGVWYGSHDIETTVCESVYHWRRFLADSFSTEDRMIVGERRVFTVRCDGILIDLRGKERAHPKLIDRLSYAYTQGVGRYLHHQGQNGLLVRSARSKGINAAVLRSVCLSNVRDKCHLTYVTNPTQDLVTVERQRGRVWLKLYASRLS
jgi:hypothetical protein